MKIVLIIAITFIFLAASIYYLTGYRSAFEADQKCHSELVSEYLGSSEYNCDHDLETRQWLLFKEGVNSSPALVLKRFRY